MRKIFTIIAAALLTATVWAQSPQKMSYQAVIRNSSNVLITSTAVGIKISILQGTSTGTAVYVETQAPTTNVNGLASLEIGSGTILLGTFASIDWTNGPYFIKTETDPTGGTNYTVSGTTQLLSVPYALHSKTAENLTGSITETDPVFIISPANGITTPDITNWNAAYGWGNHASAGYLTNFTETDPIFFASPAKGITSTNVTNWNTAYGWGNHASAGYLTSFTETDPLFFVSPAKGITSTNITNWNTAYGWGNHASAGYLTSFTETDPLFFVSPAKRITSTSITNWNSAYSWGNHATAGYLTSYTETDPVWIASSPNYYTKTNMQTSGASQLHFNNLINKPTTLAGYGITDAMSTSHAANSITATNILNWNTAYSWGNHAGLYLPIGWVPAWTDITGKPGFATVATSGNYNDLINKPTLNNGTVTNVTGTSPISIATGTTIPSISISMATSSSDGYLSSTDWNTFNSKQNMISAGQGLSLSGATISIANGGITNPMLANNAVSILTGSGLSGGGPVLLGGSLSLTNTGVLSVSTISPLGSSGGQNPNISLTGIITIVNGGTAASNANAARINLGAASSGNNGDITSLLSLTTPLFVGMGGTGASNANTARVNLGAASSGTNGDITSLLALTTPLSVSQGGTGASAFLQGSVVFAGASGKYTQTNANFFWDNTNNKLGIGKTNPATPLDVNGIITATGGNSANWNTAYGWGNHAGLYLPIDWVPAWTDITGEPIFASVATSGNYNDLLNKPTLFSGVYSDLVGKPDIWDSTWASIKNKPTLFDGQYSSLINMPTNVSAFANDAGYLTSFTEADSSVTNEIQTLSIHKDTLALSLNGGSVKLPNVVSNVHITSDSLYITYTNGQVITAGYVGNGKTGSSLSSVVTGSVIDISYTSASVNATIPNNGNEFILTKGVCLSGNSAPDLNDTVYVSGNGSGNFLTVCNQLSSNKTYYVRAFATNTVGTSYGNELSFVTKAFTVPPVTTQVISNITITTAISGGNITEDGGNPVLVRGICWSLNSNPTTVDNFATSGIGIGSYITLMTGLTSNTLYHVRAYATNVQGTSYGSDLSFTTIALQLAAVTTTAVSSISYITAMSGGNVTTDNGSSVTSRGICWATTTLPTTVNTKYSEAGGLGSFSASISGLATNTTYYVRAFAINGAGTSYGNQISLTTLITSAPSLTTKSIVGISSYIAGSGGVITIDGGSAITAKGICWNLISGPTLANSFTTDGTGAAGYNSTLTGLNPLTTYFVRAYATNGLGTSYGNEISFTTTDLINPGPSVPVVGTSSTIFTGTSTASSGGYVSADGGSTVTARGICWSTSVNPTLVNNYSADGSGLGFFTSTVSGLTGCSIVYYFRAYATNSTGTGYGSQNSLTTGLPPAIVTTDDLTSISYYTAVSGGSVPDDGGCPITQKGVCWGYTSNPTNGNWHTSEGAGSGAFVSNITGLFANKTYYVRSYATNSKGTTYGSQKVFTTTIPSTLYFGQNYAGGIIFYLDGTGEHGLVCAPADQGNFAWGCYGSLIIATGTIVGTGASNTAAIVGSCGESNIAAKICDNLVLNSYSDWFLPSKDELGWMYTNLKAPGLASFSTTNFYWSSSDYNSVWSAWAQNFTDGYSAANSKNNLYFVRAVRAF